MEAFEHIPPNVTVLEDDGSLPAGQTRDGESERLMRIDGSPDFVLRWFSKGSSTMQPEPDPNLKPNYPDFPLRWFLKGAKDDDGAFLRFPGAAEVSGRGADAS